MQATRELFVMSLFYTRGRESGIVIWSCVGRGGGPDDLTGLTPGRYSESLEARWNCRAP